jgi:serine/threonine-protein kinase RsbW
MRLQPGEIEDTLSIAPEAREFSRAAAWLASSCGAHGVPDDECYKLDICLNEALANVLAHGGSAALERPIDLKLVFSGGPEAGVAWLTLIAGGVPFDQSSHSPRPPPRTLEEAEPGGLGVLMMRANAERITYERIGDANGTAFMVCWGVAPGADVGDARLPAASRD